MSGRSQRIYILHSPLACLVGLDLYSIYLYVVLLIARGVVGEDLLARVRLQTPLLARSSMFGPFAPDGWGHPLNLVAIISELQVINISADHTL